MTSHTLSRVTQPFEARLHQQLPEDWNEIVAALPGGGHLQTSEWSRAQQRRGWVPLGLTILRSGELVGSALVVERRVGHVGSIGYIASGPQIAEGVAGLHEAVSDALRALANKRGLRVLLVGLPAAAADAESVLRARGFIDTPFTVTLPATVLVDLSPSEDDILAAMKPKMRYNVRKGLKSGALVRAGTPDDVPTFHALVSATARRQGFEPPPLEHLAAMHDEMYAAGLAQMFLGEIDGRAVSGILTIAWGDTLLYKRGGWSGEAGEKRPNELVHWQAMRWARERGFRWYDLDGIDRSVAEAVIAGLAIPEEHTESVSRFKLGFGGTPVLLPPLLSFVPNRALRLGYRRVLPRLARFDLLRGLGGA